jgi:hypothetical protein
VAVDPADLLFPVGPLEAAVLWPGVSPAIVKGYLDAFIADGVTRVASWAVAARDAGTKQWAIYRALDAVVRGYVYNASQVAFADEGSAGMSSEQFRMMQADRDAALAAFEELEGEVAGDDGSYAVTTSLR